MSYKLPPVTHGNFLSTVTQTYTGSTTTATSTGQTVYFTTAIDASSGISLVDGYKFVVSSSGDYQIVFSTIIDQSSGNNVSYELWFLKNGALVSNSNTRTVNANATSEQVMCASFIIDLVTNDNVSLCWFADGAGGTLKAVAAVGSIRPATPSIIVTVVKISE